MGGAFVLYNNIDINRIARLNADGSLDNTFNIGTGANDGIQTIFSLPDGKIIIGGNFTSFNGTSVNRIARLNADGSFDQSFDIGSGANLIINTISGLSDDKILIGGQFTSYNSVARSRIARLNADGSLDTEFNPSSGANGTIFASTVQPDGKILIGGNFTTYSGINRNRIARIFDADAPSYSPELHKNSFSIYPNPASHLVHIEFDKTFLNSNLEIYNTSGQLMERMQLRHIEKCILNVSQWCEGFYFISVISENGVVNKKFIKQ